MYAIEQMGAPGEATISPVPLSNWKLRPAKTMALWMLPCLLPMAACAAAEKPAPTHAQLIAQGGAASILAAYVLLHQTRNDGVPGAASARLGTCNEHNVATGAAQPPGARQ